MTQIFGIIINLFILLIIHIVSRIIVSIIAISLSLLRLISRIGWIYRVSDYHSLNKLDSYQMSTVVMREVIEISSLINFEVKGETQF